MFMTQFKYISLISNEELENNAVIPCVDEENYSCILIKNSKNKVVQSGYSTDNLEVKLNRILTKNCFDYYFHIIKSKNTDAYSKHQFNTIFEYVFKKIEYPIDDVELSTLITSLEDYFKVSPEKNKREIQIGVFGELLTINYLYNAGYEDIVNKFHSNFYSKHDVEINDKVRLEIKSTTSEKRIHHFKHNQIMRKDVDVILSSVLLEESKEGKTLKSMFEDVMNLFSNPDSKFALQKLMIKCGVAEEDEGMSFSFEKALNEIKFFGADVLPKIPIESFEGVYNIEYDVDCSNCDNISIDELIKNWRHN